VIIFLCTLARSQFCAGALLGRAVDWLGEANLSRVGAVLLAARRSGRAAVAEPRHAGLSPSADPTGTAFTFPDVTALVADN
jgi:hypothetical protein